MNNENLIKNSDLTPEERRERARKAGKQSAKVRRAKKTMREAAQMILDLKAPQNIAEQLKKMGIKSEDCVNQTAILIGIMQKALKGDVRAAEFFRDTIGTTGSASNLPDDPLTESIFEEIDNGAF